MSKQLTVCYFAGFREHQGNRDGGRGGPGMLAKSGSRSLGLLYTDRAAAAELRGIPSLGVTLLPSTTD